jgi:hypothetical protein
MLIEAESRLLSVVEHWLPRIDVAGIPSATAKPVIATVVGVWENWLSACSAEGERHADMAAQALALRRIPQSAGRLLPGARHGHAVHGWVWSGGRPVGPLRPDFGSAVSAVVGALKRRPELSGARALVGMAFGGFLAFRAAAAVENLVGVVSINGLFDLGSFPDSLPAIYRDNMCYALRGSYGHTGVPSWNRVGRLLMWRAEGITNASRAARR